MAADLTVVPFSRPALEDDIPAALRNLANLLESGQAQMPTTLLTVEERPDGSITSRNFGKALMRAAYVGVLQMAVIHTATSDWEDDDAE